MVAGVTVPFGLRRVLEAVNIIHERVARVAVILEDAAIPYAVVGGLAVGEWVGRVDKAAIRFTKDVDILIERKDLVRMQEAMSEAGFIYGNTMDVDFFMDGPDGSVRDGVHLLYSGERVKATDLVPAPDVSSWQPAEKFRVIGFQELVQMKLTSYRRKDQVHLLDMIGVGLLDQSSPAKFLPELGARLQILLDDPNG